MFVVGVLLAIAIGEKMVVAITRRAAFEIVDRHLGNGTDENAEGCAQDKERYIPPPSDEDFMIKTGNTEIRSGAE